MLFNGEKEMAFIESNRNVKQYTDILRDNLCNKALKFGISDSYYFQQDNDPTHIACITKLWLLFNIKNKLQMPPQSPACHKSIESTPKPLQAVIEAKGMHTKY